MQVFKYIEFLYHKWIKRSCPHICAFCAFRHRECFDEFKRGLW